VIEVIIPTFTVVVVVPSLVGVLLAAGAHPARATVVVAARINVRSLVLDLI